MTYITGNRDKLNGSLFENTLGIKREKYRSVKNRGNEQTAILLLCRNQELKHLIAL